MIGGGGGCGGSGRFDDTGGDTPAVFIVVFRKCILTLSLSLSVIPYLSIIYIDRSIFGWNDDDCSHTHTR